MFDVEASYKVIFEALFEQQGINNIVKKVHEYTNAFVYLILMSGEILACSCAEEEMKTASAKNNHITIADYELMQINIRKTDHAVYAEGWNKYYHIAEFEVKGKKVGYSILAFEDEAQKDNMEKVNEIFCQALGMYYKDTKKEVYENIPMRRQICAWTIFSEAIQEANNLELLEKEILGKYFLAYVPCKAKGISKQKTFQQIQGVWNKSLFAFEEDAMCAFFYGVDETSRENIILELKKLGYSVCVSELFTNMRSCRHKRDFLKQMNSFNGHQKTGGVLEEKNWYVETVFSYATSMFCDAGFNDYFIEQLCKEDEEKNLELYNTLKMYLLCENSISVTASKLHVHRNTLVYRLKQIQNCIGKDINDRKVSKELLAFMIMYDIARKTENK